MSGSAFISIISWIILIGKVYINQGNVYCSVPCVLCLMWFCNDVCIVIFTQRTHSKGLKENHWGWLAQISATHQGTPWLAWGSYCLFRFDRWLALPWYHSYEEFKLDKQNISIKDKVFGENISPSIKPFVSSVIEKSCKFCGFFFPRNFFKISFSVSTIEE